MAGRSLTAAELELAGHRTWLWPQVERAWLLELERDELEVVLAAVAFGGARPLGFEYPAEAAAVQEALFEPAEPTWPEWRRARGRELPHEARELRERLRDA